VTAVIDMRNKLNTHDLLKYISKLPAKAATLQKYPNIRPWLLPIIVRPNYPK
jgi:hypothetical protein